VKNPTTWALLAIAAVASSNIHATQTAAVMVECKNCTPTQMQTKAKNQPIGYQFVYDLANNIVRKYDVYWDSTCIAPPVVQDGPGGADQTQAAQGNGPGVDCGSFKAADEVSPVDPDVQDIFDSLHGAWLVNPTLVNTGKVIRIDPLMNPRTHQPFDPARIAWDYPAGTYEDLREYLWSELENRATANDISPGLGDYIEGVSIAVNGADIGVGVLVHISLDRMTGTIRIDICNANGDCAKVEVHVNNGAITNVTFDGSFDTDNNIYPNANGTPPGQGGHWNFGNGSDASHFGQFLGNAAGYSIPSPPGCGPSYHLGLTIARVNGQIDSATWQCVANP
jgi:hypothetical protein